MRKLLIATCAALVVATAQAGQNWISVEDLQEGVSYPFASITLSCARTYESATRFTFGPFESMETDRKWGQGVWHAATNKHFVRTGWDAYMRAYLKRDAGLLWSPAKLGDAFDQMVRSCAALGR
jgi:hypothetical protein